MERSATDHLERMEMRIVRFGAAGGGRSLGSGALLVALCLLLVGAGSDSSKIQYSDAFMVLVKEHRFAEAAKTFFYSAGYTPQRLAREEATIGGFLESLSKVAGDLSDQTLGAPAGANKWLTLGISGTDGPVSPSDIGADTSDIVYYRGRFANEGAALITLYLVHVRGNWRILRFDFGIPADRGPDSLAEFSRKVFAACGACQPGKET